MLDLSKPVQTKDGRKVRILCTDAKGDYPVVGVTIGELKDTANTWTSDGSFHIDGRFHENDLINIAEIKDFCTCKSANADFHVPEPAEEIEGWINMTHNDKIYPRKADADFERENDTIACIKIKFKKGDGIQ